MPIANYTTEVKPEKSIGEIMDMLRKHNASDILLNCSAGKTVGLAFIIETKHGPLSFHLPAHIEKVYTILLNNRRAAWDDEVKKKVHLQAERVAWRILRDWIRAQMAIVETEMVTIEEVFLPYLQIHGKSLYNTLAEGQFKQLQLKGGVM